MKDFFKGVFTIELLKAFFKPTLEDLQYVYLGMWVFVLANTYLTSEQSLVTVLITAVVLNVGNYFYNKTSIKLRNLIFAYVPATIMLFTIWLTN